MPTISRRFSLVACVALACCAGRGVPAVELTPAAKPFVEQHCVECHDGDVQKGGVRLDNLSADLANPEVARHWVEAYDKVAAGEMPPAKQPKPSPADRAAFLAWVKGGVSSAELAARHADGRVLLRRLNRSEYENSIRELLGVESAVRDLLPEDTSAMGFDNVAAALSTSSVLMERYLEAADVALDAAIATGPRPETKTATISYGPVTNNPADYRLKRGVRLEPDGTFLIFNSGDLQSQCDRFKAPAEGRYRIRIPASAWHTEGKPLVLSIMAGSFDPKNPRKRTVGFFDIPPGTPRVIEFEEYLPKGGTFKVMGERMPRVALQKEEDRAAYQGAGLAIGMVEVTGPVYASWPPAGHRRLFGELDFKTATAADARRVLAAFVPRAFRRPVPADEVAAYADLAKAQLDAGKPFDEAIRVALKAVLCSPRFLFLTETPGRLDAYAVASRLSYFLWSGAPDEELTKVAADGGLAKPPVLHAQVERMLKDPRAAQFTENFTGQWLGLRQLDFTQPDKRLYPEFDDLLQWSMLAESRGFFDEVLGKDLSLLNFVDSDFVMANGRLAELYGLPNVTGADVRRVPLPPGSHRGGVLGQAAVLKVTANGTSTSPVVRGAWVMRNLVGRPPKPPPPDVPAIEPDTRGAHTVREQLAKHRELGQCAACHAKIDPAGNALESFDVIGGWRENYRTLAGTKVVKLNLPDGRNPAVHLGPPVDPADQWIDGQAFANVDAFKQCVLRDKDRVAHCLAEKLTVYATGAGLDFVDRPAIDAIIARVRAKGYGFRTLVHEVVASEVFLSK